MQIPEGVQGLFGSAVCFRLGCWMVQCSVALFCSHGLAPGNIYNSTVMFLFIFTKGPLQRHILWGCDFASPNLFCVLGIDVALNCITSPCNLSVGGRGGGRRNGEVSVFICGAVYKCRSDKCQCSGSSGTKDALPQKYFICRIDCIFHLTAKTPQAWLFHKEKREGDGIC
ncbi:hypothetical protein EK904_004228 [Melospiza melodia maxima]|nr:hypothetical protein EK904_004228 [Melospiza melodia maxima]